MRVLLGIWSISIFVSAHMLMELADATEIQVAPSSGHTGTVVAVAFSRDGSLIVSGSDDNTMKLWDAKSGAVIRTIPSSSGDTPRTVAISPDGRFLLYGSDRPADKEYAVLELIDAANGTLVRAFDGHGVSVDSVAFSPDGSRILSGSGDGTAQVWETDTGQVVSTLGVRDFRGASVNSVAFSPDGSLALTGDDSGTLKIWKVTTGKQVRAVHAHEDAITSVTFSPDGKRILSGSKDKSVKLWDAATGGAVRTLTGHQEDVNAVAYFPDNDRVISAGSDDQIKLWDVNSGQLLRTIELKFTIIRALAVSPGGAEFVSGDMRNGLKLWDASSGQLVRNLDGTTSDTTAVGPAPAPQSSDEDGMQVNYVALSTDGSRLLVGSDPMRVWDLKYARPLASFEGYLHPRAIAMSLDGRRVAAGNWKTQVWDAGTGALVAVTDRSAERIAVSPNGSYILTAPDGINLLDASSGELIRKLDANITGSVRALAFSSDGQFAAACEDDTIKIWKVETGEKVWEFPARLEYPSALALSADGTRIAASGDEHIKVWQTSTRTLVTDIEAGDVTSIAFSPTANQLASGDSNSQAKIWNLDTGKLDRTLTGHGGWVTSVAYSSDGNRIVTGSWDKTAKFWDAKTGALLATIQSRSDGEWIISTPEGFFAASAKGTEMLSVVQGTKTIKIDRFYDALYRPDLVVAKLAGDPDGKVKKAAAELSLDKILASGPAPRTAITSHKPADSSQSDVVTVVADIQDSGGGIGKVEWRVNGVTSAAGATAKSQASSLILSQQIILEPGDNTIEVIAYNKAGLVAAQPARTKITWTGTHPTILPKLYVLAVGINDYEMSKLKLNLAVADATSLAGAFSQADSAKALYDDVVISTVYDKNATTAGLASAFNALASKIRPRDVFIFFAAGHGATRDGRYYFIPQDFRYQTDSSIQQSAIGQDKWQEWFAEIPARKSILMFDTCQSGTIASNSEFAIATRGDLEEMAAVGRLIQATGRNILTASNGTQSALEGYKGHGVFTYSVLEALARGDRNNDGFIELTELAGYVDNLVPQITESKWHLRQFPQMMLQGSDFPIAKQLPSVAPSPSDEVIISTKPTHVLPEGAKVFAAAGGSGAVIQELGRYSLVTVVKSENGWVLVARGGTLLGFISEAKLQPVQ